MSIAWEELIKLYDKLVDDGKPVCPVAHTYLTAHVGVLIDKNGNFLAAMKTQAQGELVAVPCTIESEGRTNNIAPHLLSDQLRYVTEFPGQESKYKKYLSQLKQYTDNNKDDVYASAIYKYTLKNSLMDDIKDVLSDFGSGTDNIIFAVYGVRTDGKDPMWTEYYINSLGKTGLCSLTGKPDYIPESYPRDILSQGDRARLFIGRSDELNSYPRAAPGYVASQKIIHALQYMIYGRKNAKMVEAQYKIIDHLRGDIPDDEFIAWMEKNYPGKIDMALRIISKATQMQETHEAKRMHEKEREE